MKAIIGFVLLSACFSSVISFNAGYFDKYEGYTVYRIHPNTIGDLEILQIISKQYSRHIDFWTEIRAVNRPVDIMVDNEMKDSFVKSLTLANLKFNVMIDNVKDMINKQIQENSKPSGVGDFDYGRYHTLDEINEWIDTIYKSYAKYVTIIKFATSSQGRPVRGFKISVSQNKTKPAIFIDGGIHAREWIATASVVYIGYTLVSQYGADAEITKFLNLFDVYVLPVFNVDGYAYTFTDDRMWRKTRSVNANSTCIGVDPNRNYDSHFCEQGSSTDPCDEAFCGPKAFSEPEVKGVADYLITHNSTIVCYINFHSYSQIWMSPWGYTTAKPANFTLQDNGSIAAIQALQKLYGTVYDHGNVGEIIYIASGGSIDWTYDTANIFFSYGVELRDTGDFGFLLPPDQIIPSGNETLEALKALGFYITKFI